MNNLNYPVPKGFECHMTLRKSDKELVLSLLDTWETKTWHVSEINGDPDLGAGDRLYITGYLPDYDAIFNEMIALSDVLIRKGVSIARYKIEAIVFDTKGA